MANEYIRNHNRSESFYEAFAISEVESVTWTLVTRSANVSKWNAIIRAQLKLNTISICVLLRNDNLIWKTATDRVSTLAHQVDAVRCVALHCCMNYSYSCIARNIYANPVLLLNRKRVIHLSSYNCSLWSNSLFAYGTHLSHANAFDWRPLILHIFHFRDSVWHRHPLLLLLFTKLNWMSQEPTLTIWTQVKL